jgi:hypothetical protein
MIPWRVADLATYALEGIMAATRSKTTKTKKLSRTATMRGKTTGTRTRASKTTRKR